MKRIIPAVLCIAAALMLSAGSFFYIKAHTEKLYKLAGEVLEADENTAYGKAETLCKEWESSRVTFGALLKHSDADELENYFLLTEYYAEKENIEKLYDTVENCRAALTVILKGEKPDAANIF